MKKVWATGPGSARPVVSMTTRSKFSSPLRQRGAEILADRAAHAAVGQLHDLLLGVRDQDLVVDVLLAELVLDDGDLLAVHLGEDALEQRGLARAEEAGQDGGGDELVGHCFSGFVAKRRRAHGAPAGAGGGGGLSFKPARLSREFPVNQLF